MVQIIFYHTLFKEIAINFIDFLSGNIHYFISFEDHALHTEKIHLMEISETIEVRAYAD